MRAKTISRNGSASTPDSTVPLAGDGFHDFWDPAGKSRTVIDPSGARTTFIFDAKPHTVMQSPLGGRFTLTSCASQMTVRPAGLSHFGAHVELRVQPTTSVPADTPIGAFLGHDESQRHFTLAATAALREPSQRGRLLDDVIQQANLQLLEDLRRGKAIFEGDDPERFARWFQGTSHNVVIDVVEHFQRTGTASKEESTTADVADPKAVEPMKVAVVRELAALACDEIERIPETHLREVMVDLRDDKSIRESAKRLGISKSKVDRMQKRGCRQIAARLGN